ncbi:MULTISPECIES: hypothetical protein [Kitasatospora]|uniref:Recombinase family protein n=1 Tax=Kitasatospora arboriphila TaxID=258052 RepID=A0ABP4EDM3_9ACTN
MTLSPARSRRAAIYLRCYPYDRWEMLTQLHALQDHASSLGLACPRVLIDTVGSSCLARDGLRSLLALAAAGDVDTVLVPGPWAFSLDEPTARSVAGFLHSTGAEVVELPRGLCAA